MTTPAQDRDIRAALSAPRRRPSRAATNAARSWLLGPAQCGSAYHYRGHTEGCVWSLRCDGTAWTAVCRGVSYGPYPTAAEAGGAMLEAHPELWSGAGLGVDADPSPAPDPLREALAAMREALRLLRRAGHESTRAEDPAGDPYCCICDEDWPCDVEQARRRLAAALEDR